MKLKAIRGAVTFILKKYSPEILLGVGIVGVACSTVLACKATLNAEAILDSYEEQKEKIEDCVALRITSEVNYSVQDEKMDRRSLVLATAGKFIRLYGPSVTLYAASVGCILASYRIMKRRNIALMAAYKLIEEAFSKYRSRVVEELGTQADDRFYHGTEVAEGAATATVVDEDGTEHEVVAASHHLSGFSRFFEDEKPDQMGGWTGSTQWSPVHEYNLDFLNTKKEHFDGMLMTKGFVTINDVYSELGFPPTEAGMVCGWRYKSDRGDGYISFKPRNIDGNWNFGNNGCSILLDFNIDGVIFDQDAARKEMK